VPSISRGLQPPGPTAASVAGSKNALRPLAQVATKVDGDYRATTEER